MRSFLILALIIEIGACSIVNIGQDIRVQPNISPQFQRSFGFPDQRTPQIQYLNPLDIPLRSHLESIIGKIRNQGQQSKETLLKNNIITSQDITKQQRDQFKQKYNKKYLSSSRQVQTYRTYIYASKKSEVMRHNANQSRKYSKGINQFTDMTVQQYSKTYLGTRPTIIPEIIVDNNNLRQLQEISSTTVSINDNRININLNNNKNNSNDSDPTGGRIVPSINWEERGLFTSAFQKVQSQDKSRIKNQGDCGSCYIFATIAAIESHVKILKKQSVYLSEQHILDCCLRSNGYNCNGCADGNLEAAFSFSAQYGNIQELSYPYQGKTNSCKASNLKTKNYLNKNQPYKLYTPGADFMFTRKLLSEYPVIALVDATNWDPYKNGIFDDCRSQPKLNHGVLVVGFDPTGAWIVKNWFGTGWGEDGYIYVDMYKDCGINKVIIVPNLE